MCISDLKHATHTQNQPTTNQAIWYAIVVCIICLFVFWSDGVKWSVSGSAWRVCSGVLNAFPMLQQTSVQREPTCGCCDTPEIQTRVTLRQRQQWDTTRQLSTLLCCFLLAETMDMTTAKTTASFLSTVSSTSMTPILTVTTDIRMEQENVTESRTKLMTTSITITTTNETSFNATKLPELELEGSEMGMVLVPFGIITVIGLTLVVVRKQSLQSLPSFHAHKICLFVMTVFSMNESLLPLLSN